MRIAQTFLVIGLITWFPPATSAEPRPPTHATNPRLGQAAPTPLAAKDLSIEKIRMAVETARPSSKAEFLKLLPPECKKYYMLVHESRATPCSSFAKPRILMSCSEDSGEFQIAIDGEGENTRPGECEGVEILQVDRESGQIKSAEIRFHGKAVPPYQYHSSPKRCTACHGETPRFLSDRYPLWPGYYDSVLREMKKGSPEHQGYQKFKAVRDGGDPLYSQITPYLEQAGEEHTTLRVETPDFSFTSAYFNKLDHAQHGRIARLLQKHPDYERFRFALAAAALNCSKLEEYLPEQSRKEGTSLEAMERRIREGVRRADARVVKDIARFNFPLGQGGVFKVDEATIRRVAAIAFVAERMGIDPGFLSSSPSPHEYTFPTGTLEIRASNLAIQQKCGEPLQRASHQALSAASPKRLSIPVRDLGPKEAMAKCVDCHRQGLAERLGTVPIPFGDPNALKQHLKREPALRESILNRIQSNTLSRMPPNERLDPNESQGIVRFLSTAAK